MKRLRACLYRLLPKAEIYGTSHKLKASMKTSRYSVVNVIASFGMSLVFLGMAHSVRATTYTVNSPEDTDDATCVHPYVDAANDCTLREAINESNNTATIDTIAFSMDASFQANPSYYSSGQYTITLGSALPSLSSQTTLSAASVWDAANERPGIRLYSATKTYNVITATTGSDNSQIAGLEMQGFSTAIQVNTASITIGTNCDGTTDTHERNVIHGGVYGVYLTKTNAIVAGNYIGLDDDGDTFDGMTTGDIFIDGAAADSNTVGFRENTTATCTAADQRNVLAGTTNNATLLSVFGTGSNTSGDATTGADSNRISGNYIGVDKTGTKDRSGVIQNSSLANTGVRLSNAATLNWIGTDGDGVDDSSEGNVIYASSVGITTIGTTSTGTNRISGNYVGVDATGNTVIGTAMEVGSIIQGVANIIGWCDATDHATLCSDLGTTTTQRNVFGGANTDQVRFGVSAQGSYVYGNNIGVGTDSTSDVSTVTGFFVHRSSGNNVIGGSGNRANRIQYNTIGIQVNGDYTGNRTNGVNQTPITNTTITNNTITQNSTAGIQFYWTENFGTSSVTASNNTITQNGIGIDIDGSSPTVSNNTMNTNTSYGIYVRPAFIKRNASGWNANEATESNDPADASTNILSSPTITGNTITGNSSYGIYQLDARSTNYATLFADNTINTNNSTAAIVQAWYGAVELLDRNNTPIPASSWSGVSITVTPTAASGTALTSQASAAVNTSDVIFGPTSVAYSNVTSWFSVIDYTVSDAGTVTSYNPYTITASGTYTTTTGKQYTFDGVDNDTTYTGVLANGITTSSLYRFQIGKSVASSVPATPTNTSPTNGTTTDSLTPTLSASSFSDTTETHSQSIWQIYSTAAACSNNGTGNIYTSTSNSNLTTLTVPASTLQGATTYYWHVAYINAFGNTSSYSSCTSFTTIRTAPQHTVNLPDFSWNEDETSTTLDLDDYFSDAQGDTLTYTPTWSDSTHINVAISTQTQVLTLSSSADWSGTATMSFTACDAGNECATSNTAAISVVAVNDSPTAPTGSPSPNETTIAQLQPTFDWEAGSDVEDSTAALSYELWLATTEDVVTNPVEQWTSVVGATTLTADTTLDDLTTYYYSIRTVDSAGATSDWSDTFSFTIDIGALPNLTLTKSLQIIENSTAAVGGGIALASGPNGIQFFKGFITVALSLSLLSCVVALFGLAQKVVWPKHLAIVLFKHPAIAFAALNQPNSSGMYTTSYSDFFRRIMPFRLVFQVSLVVTLVFVSLRFVSQMTFASTTVIAPADTIRFTLTYRNTGEAAATAVHVSDALPAGTSLVANSIVAVPEVEVSRHNDNLTTQFTTIASDVVGTVQYDMIFSNPTTLQNLTIPVATATLAELPNETVSSNQLSVEIQTAVLQVIVQASDGQPIVGANLTLYDRGGTAADALWTDTTHSNGTATTSGWRADTYLLNTSADGYQTAKATAVELDYNILNTTTIILSPTGGSNVNENNNSNSDVNTNVNTDVNTNTNVNTNVNVNTDLDTNTNKTVPDQNLNNSNESNQNNENVNHVINGNTNTKGNKPINDNGNTNTNVSQPVPDNTTEAVTNDVNVVGQVSSLIVPIQDFFRDTKSASEVFLARPANRWLATAVQVAGVFSWVATASADVGLISTTAMSVNEMALIGGRFFSLIFGIRRKRQSWGVVYDAVTKRPLDPAYVTVHTADGQQIAESITDLDGRYEFFLPPNTYRLQANKTHYIFPSKHLRGRSRDELYDNLYFGESFMTQANEVITRNIPLDPVEFDWNEFEKNAQGQFQFYKKQYHRLRWLGYSLFIIGLGLSVFSWWIQPTWYNAGAVVLYGCVLLVHFLWLPKRRSSALRYYHGGSIPFAVIKVYSARLKREVKATVADAFGRFYLLLQPGMYYWTVAIRRGEHDYEIIYQSEPVQLRQGILPKRIIIPQRA